jgi:hypothetical protein
MHLDLPSRGGARSRPTFTASLNPAGRRVDEVPGGFVGAARALFRAPSPVPPRPFFTADANVWQPLP